MVLIHSLYSLLLLLTFSYAWFCYVYNNDDDDKSVFKWLSRTLECRKSQPRSRPRSIARPRKSSRRQTLSTHLSANIPLSVSAYRIRRARRRYRRLNKTGRLYRTCSNLPARATTMVCKLAATFWNFWWINLRLNQSVSIEFSKFYSSLPKRLYQTPKAGWRIAWRA